MEIPTDVGRESEGNKAVAISLIQRLLGSLFVGGFQNTIDESLRVICGAFHKVWRPRKRCRDNMEAVSPEHVEITLELRGITDVERAVFEGPSACGIAPLHGHRMASGSAGRCWRAIAIALAGENGHLLQ